MRIETHQGFRKRYNDLVRVFKTHWLLSVTYGGKSGSTHTSKEANGVLQADVLRIIGDDSGHLLETELSEFTYYMPRVEEKR